MQVRCSGAAVLRAIFMWAVVGGLGEIWRDLVWNATTWAR
jgi:hypothetical protein